jgi:hypothetical protein
MHFGLQLNRRADAVAAPPEPGEYVPEAAAQPTDGAPAEVVRVVGPMVQPEKARSSVASRLA